MHVQQQAERQISIFLSHPIRADFSTPGFRRLNWTWELEAGNRQKGQGSRQSSRLNVRNSSVSVCCRLTPVIAKGTLLQYSASSHILREVEGLQKVIAKVIDGTRLIGYARVSSDDQNLNMQIDALERAGCEVIYKDGGISGVKHRPALAKALKDLQPGDTFVFWKLDRLGRGALDLLNMLEDFEKRGINIKSLTEPIDTTTAMGKAFYRYVRDTCLCHAGHKHVHVINRIMLYIGGERAW